MNHEENTAPAEFELDAILHQPLRTQVVAYLAGRGTATFTELKKAINASDGNLESHLKKLIAADYVRAARNTGASGGGSNARPQTLYALTDVGAAALKVYLARLELLLDFARQVPARSVDEDADEARGGSLRPRPA